MTSAAHSETYIHPGHPWHDGPLTGFDTETTGVNVEHDRIVTAAIVERIDQETTTVHNWLINPGVEIPEGAAQVHGITTEHARAHGAEPAQALDEMADVLARNISRGVPIVAFNVIFDLTILDAELNRHQLPTVAQRSGCEISRVLDPLVIDRGRDRYRRGKRTLAHLCEHYGVSQNGDLHSADVDVAATLAVLHAQCEKYPDLKDKTLDDVHAWQVTAHRTWAESFREFLRSKGRPFEGVELHWPVR